MSALHHGDESAGAAFETVHALYDVRAVGGARDRLVGVHRPAVTRVRREIGSGRGRGRREASRG